MNYDFTQFKKKTADIEEWLKRELSFLRTSRASPSLIDNVGVNYYGQKTPVKHLAAIDVEDARTLRIRPWDSSLIQQIEQEIRFSELGLQPIVEKDSIRVIFPELTEERRKNLLKILSKKLEEARIVVRQARDECSRDIQNKEKDGRISEDEKFRFKDDLQKLVDESMSKLENLSSAKEKEIQN